MKRALFTLLALTLAASPALTQTSTQTPAQVWFKVAVESNTITTAVPIMLRFGTATGITSAGVNCAAAPGCWTAATLASTPMINVQVSCCGWLGGLPDPAPGLVKEVDVLEVSTAQALTVNNNAVTVPALPAPPPPASYTLTFVPGHVYAANFTSVTVIPNTPAAAILALFPLAPSMFVGSALSNFNEDLMLNGMLLHCTFGAIDTAGKPYLNCIPAPVPAN